MGGLFFRTKGSKMNILSLTKGERFVILALFKNELFGGITLRPEGFVNYFDIVGMAGKIYNRTLLPVCRKWELTRNAVDVLLFLHNNPHYDRASDIVAHRGMAKSHVSLSVTDLENRGLLLRIFDPADRRTAHLQLTEQGRTIAEEARLLQDEFFSRIHQGVTEEELAFWGQVNRKVCANIEQIEKTLPKE